MAGCALVVRRVGMPKVPEPQLCRPLAQRLCAVEVRADNGAGAVAVVAGAGEQLVEGVPQLTNDDAEGRHLQAGRQRLRVLHVS